MTSQVEVPPLTGLIHFNSGKRRVNSDDLCVFVDDSGIIFSDSPEIHMLWVSIRNLSVRHF